MTTSLAVRGLTERERFEQYVYPDPNSGCFIWAGATNRKGYGAFAAGSRTNGTHKRITAHRYAWTLSGRDLPADACLLHKCDTPCCVNPDHLFLGTRADNNLDMSRKGRGYRGSGKLPFGVQRHPSGRYAVVVWDGTRMAFYGMFDDLSEAATAALAAKDARIASTLRGRAS